MCIHLQVIALDAAPVLQFAVCTDVQLLCLHYPGVVDADTLVTADEADAAAVHAAEVAGINGNRCGTVTASFLHVTVAVYTVSTGDDVQLLVAGAHRSVDFRRFGDDGGVVAVAHIQSVRTDGDTTLLDIDATEGAILQFGFAARQPGFIRVDKSAAVDADTRWIGDDNVRPFARHFDGAMQTRRIAAVDLVDDHAGVVFD